VNNRTKYQYIYTYICIDLFIHNCTIALIQDGTRVDSSSTINSYVDGATVLESNVNDPISLTQTFHIVSTQYGPVDTIISCLSSRSGMPREAYQIDYQATLHCLRAG
jgi:regulatory protein YycH of two-component signal transduction system YycFG